MRERKEMSNHMEERGKGKKDKKSNGEGNIRYKTDNLIEGRAMLNGKVIYVYVKASYKGDEKAEKEARKKLKKAISQAELTGVIESHMKLEEWMQKWVELRKGKNKLRPKTYGDYVSLISTHILGTKIGRTEIGKLTVIELEKFYLEKLNNGRIQKYTHTSGTSLSLGSIKKVHALIRASLNEAVRLDMISRNVAERVELPEEKQSTNEFGEVIDKNDYSAFSPSERIDFLEKARRSTLYPIFLTMFYTGMRVGEAIALKWRNVDLEKEELYVRESFQRVKTPYGPQKTQLVLGPPKTRAGNRKIPLPHFLVVILKEHRVEQERLKEKWGEVYQDKDLVFPIENGNYREPRNLTRSFYNIRNKAGVSPINLHGIRHTYATMLFEKKVPAKIVSVLLGHTDISVTLNIYSHVFPEILTDAVEVLTNYATEKVKDVFKEE